MAIVVDAAVRVVADDIFNVVEAEERGVLKEVFLFQDRTPRQTTKWVVVFVVNVFVPNHIGIDGSGFNEVALVPFEIVGDTGAEPFCWVGRFMVKAAVYYQIGLKLSIISEQQ